MIRTRDHILITIVMILPLNYNLCSWLNINLKLHIPFLSYKLTESSLELKMRSLTTYKDKGGFIFVLAIGAGKSTYSNV